MHKLFVMVAVSAGVLSLAGCQSTPKRDTYDTISAQVAAAAAKPAPAAVPAGDAVDNALLPPVSSLVNQLPKARAALEERFNVSFNGVPAQQFFNSLVSGTRYNMLIHPDVTGTISANLKDVTLVEALDAVRELYGYDYKIDGTRIYIRPLTMQTRIFHVNYLIGARKGLSNLKVSSTSVSSANNNNSQNQNNQNQNNNNQNNQNGQNGQNQQQIESSSVNTTTTSDFWVELKAAIEAIVGSKEGGRSVVISPQSGVLVIRAMPDELRNIDRFLQATQLSVDRQVILEAKILEVELNDSFQSGINWAAFGHIGQGGNNRVSAGTVQSGTTLAPLGAGAVASALSNGNLTATPGSAITAAAQAATGSLFGLAFQTSNFAALISFLESQGTVHVLSSPRVATLNNQKAVLKIGTDEFFVTGVTTTTNASAAGNTTTPSVQLQAFFSGVVLDVTPQIDDAGNILLHVHPSVSQVSTVNKAVNLGQAGNFSLPLAASSTSEIDSMVRGQDGRVVAIGGLMRQSSTADNSQVPLAGNIPVLGNLFRNRSNVNQKRELVVLIKPTIVEGAGNWNEDLLDTSRRIKALEPRGNN
ncbi:MAG: pilus (MSHA type) biogenesis protein MshL [Pseudomonadota bacterium]